MTRAEEAAMKAYPIEICGYTTECRVSAMPIPLDWNEVKRESYQEGYEQAEKDLALTWEDIRSIDEWISVVQTSEDLVGKKLYEEVLRRFKEEKQ